VLFQPELRRALTSIGHAPALRALIAAARGTLRVVDEIASVPARWRAGIGALIVLERGTGLRQYAERASLPSCRRLQTLSPVNALCARRGRA